MLSALSLISPLPRYLFCTFQILLYCFSILFHCFLPAWISKRTEDKLICIFTYLHSLTHFLVFVHRHIWESHCIGKYGGNVQLLQKSTAESMVACLAYQYYHGWHWTGVPYCIAISVQFLLQKCQFVLKNKYCLLYIWSATALTNCNSDGELTWVQ